MMKVTFIRVGDLPVTNWSLYTKFTSSVSSGQVATKLRDWTTSDRCSGLFENQVATKWTIWRRTGLFEDQVDCDKQCVCVTHEWKIKLVRAIRVVDGGWWMVDGGRQMQDQAESDLRDDDTELIQSQKQCHTLEPCHQQKYFISVESCQWIVLFVKSFLYAFSFY